MTTTSWAARGLVTALAQPRPLTETTLLAALTELGKTEHDVARTLDAAGHVGDRGCAGSCPIAHYLLTFWPHAAAVQVGVLNVTVEVGGVRVTVRSPEPICDFVSNFDHGGHEPLNAAAVTA